MKKNTNVLCVDDELPILEYYSSVLAEDASKSSITASIASRRRRRRSGDVAAPQQQDEDVPIALYTASSGEQALQIVKEIMASGERIAAGFFDMKMPGGIDGVETIRAIRSLDPQVLCAVVTAYTDYNIETFRSIFSQQDEWIYFNKPFSEGELRQAVFNLVGGWNARRISEKHLDTVNKQRESLRKILDSMPRLHSVQDGEALRRTILREVSTFLETDRATMISLDEHGVMLPRILEVERGPTNEVGETFVLTNPDAIDRARGVAQRAQAVQDIAVDNADLTIPFRVRGNVRSLIIANSPGFVDTNMLRVLAYHVETAMENVTLMEEERAREEQRVRINREMELAQRIQTSLLPVIEPGAESSIAAAMIPAEMVGGDYYDIITDENGHLWYGIGDVSGHGLMSGLIMLMTHSTISAIIRANPTLSITEMLSRLNRALYDDLQRLGESYHLTFCLLKSNGKGDYIVAGAHEDIVIYRAATQTCERVLVEGIWLGLMPDVTGLMNEIEIHLDPNDTMVLYTDGIVEAQANDGSQWGIERLMDAVQMHAHLSPAEMKDAILRDVRAFMDAQLDDITMMIVRRAD